MMVKHLLILALLPFIIYGRVIPAYDPEARMDEKKPGKVNQEFLSAFLGNVQSSDSSLKPIVDEIKEPIKFNSDSSKSNEKEHRNEDGYDGGYGNEIYDDGYYSDDYGNGYTSDYGYEDDHDSDKVSPYYKASINCREFHYPHATTAKQCRDVKVRDYEPDYNRDDANEKAFCRWDMGFSDEKDKHEGCLCPRTKYKCHKKDQCYWYKPKYSAHGDDNDNAQCLHNSERFYNILANLLSKRGKKDFALKIKYSSAAAKSHLPYGPWGPGYFPYDHELYKHPQIHNGAQNEYDYSYNTPHGYGHQDYATQHNDGYGHQDYSTQHNDGYGNDYYNSMSGYGGYNSMGGYGTQNYIGDHGAHNHIGGHGAHSHIGGHGAHNHFGGYGGSNHIEGYGINNQVGGHGGYNQGGYRDGSNGLGDYGSYHSVSNNQYSTGYDAIQGYNGNDIPYGNEGYTNSQPIYNSYTAEYPAHQNPYNPIIGNVPFGNDQSNYIDNSAYQPAREANSLSQTLTPISAPEYHTVPPPISEQPVHGAYPPTINSAPSYQSANLNGLWPFGQVTANYGTNMGYPPVREVNTLAGTPIKPVNVLEHQTVAPPVNAPVHQTVAPVNAPAYQGVAPAYQGVAPVVNVPIHQTVPSQVNGPLHQYRHPTQPYFH